MDTVKTYKSLQGKSLRLAIFGKILKNCQLKTSEIEILMTNLKWCQKSMFVK